MGGEEEEALHLKSLSETEYKSGNIPGALRYAHQALRISPSLPGIRPLISSLRILSSSPPDYYAILQLDPFSDLDAVRRSYKSLALSLHPDKNPSFVCQDAFKIVGDALRVLSDAGEKERYDLRLRIKMQEAGSGLGGGGGGGQGMFWSECRECGNLHEFDKGYSGKMLVCSACGKSFKAIRVGEQEGGDGTVSDNGGDRAVGGRDIMYARRRKGSSNKVGETDETPKPSDDSGGCYAGGRDVENKKVNRVEMGASNACGEGAERELETGDDETEDGFWDLKLKDAMSKRKEMEASSGSVPKSKVSIEANEMTKDGEKHKVKFKDGRREAESGKKRALRDVEEKKRVVVIGLRCITDDCTLKISESNAKLHSKKCQSREVDEGRGSGEWGWSRRRSLRVQVESAEESTQKSDEEDGVSGEEVMTLAEIQSRLVQKVSSHKGKENEREKVGAKQVGVEDKNSHESVIEQVMEDKEVEQINHRDMDDDNEYEDGEEQREKTGEVEERAGRRDMEIDKTNDKVGEDNQQNDLENEKEQDEVEMMVLANNSSVNGMENVEQGIDVTGIRPLNRNESLENGTLENGDAIEETATDTKWTKRTTRFYETKRRALSTRSKDLGSEILGTSGILGMRLSSAKESPILIKRRNPRQLVSLDSDFYDFNMDRGERKFKKGQVWAVYDELGQPRRYGLIDEVMSINPFALRLKWLVKQEIRGQDPGLSSVGCGSFKVTTSAIVKSVRIFSHEVDVERVARETYDIYPKKGSVWMIYGDCQSHDIVICLTSYMEMFGLSLGYLEKMGGFRTVYKRKDIGWDAVRWIGKDNIILLSHQIPARRLSHDDVPDSKEDFWVLDPASLSPASDR